MGGLINIFILYTLGGVSLIDPTYGFILFHNIKQSEVAAEVAPPLRSYLVNNAAVCTTFEVRLDEFKRHSSWQLGDRDMAKMHPYNGRSQNFGSNPLFAPPPYGA